VYQLFIDSKKAYDSFRREALYNILIEFGIPKKLVRLRREGCTGCWWGNLRERGHWGDPDIDGRIILRWIFRTLEGVVWTGWSWLRIGTGGGHM
jgi:hypothetical protein